MLSSLAPLKGSEHRIVKFPFFGKRKGVGRTKPEYFYSGGSFIPVGSTASISASNEAKQSLKQLEQTAKKFDPLEHLDTTRAEIAKKFVKWYLAFVMVIIIGVPLYNSYSVHSKEPLDIYKVLTTVGTILGTPLGFVVGYYFKEDKHQIIKKDD